jgi:predicted AAA+ superfamily ATPase
MDDMQIEFLPRMASAVVSRTLGVLPIVVVTGARQTGKSTLVRQPTLGPRDYCTLDDVELRDLARRDPELLLDRAPRLVIDEVQRTPDLLLAIKKRVDEHPEPGRYILTGSTNLLLQERVSESLAGRAGYVRLWPLTRREQLGLASAGLWSELLAAPPKSWPDLLSAQAVDSEPWRALAGRGGYPIPAHRLDAADARSIWFDGYASTYLERDLTQIAAVEHLADMRRLMAALCLRLGGLLNQSEIARDLALSQTTVKRYIDLLEVSHQLIRLPAYSVNRTRRLIKSPKIYWTDTGLALWLSREPEVRGAHLENVIATDLMAWSAVTPGRPGIFHWRTGSGAEVDFVIELPTRMLPIEVTSARRVGARDARHLRSFLDEYSDAADAGILLYDGDETFWVERGVLATPWHRVV